MGCCLEELWCHPQYLIFKNIKKKNGVLLFPFSGRGAHVMFSVNAPPFCKLLLFPVTFKVVWLVFGIRLACPHGRSRQLMMSPWGIFKALGKRKSGLLCVIS